MLKRVGINQYISKAIYFFSGVSLIFLIIQFFIYFIMSGVIKENQKIFKIEQEFYEIYSNSVEIESNFLNYSYGYLPSANSIKLMLDENHKLIEKLILRNPTFFKVMKLVL